MRAGRTGRRLGLLDVRFPAQFQVHQLAITPADAAEMLREDLASRGPVRVAEVEAEQKEILQIARRLSDEGQLMLGGGSDGQFL